MARLLFLVLLSIAFLPAFSQISGKVVSNKGEPLPFVNVLLLNAADSTRVSRTVSTDNGQFAFENARNGTYILQLSLISYKKLYTNSFLISSSQPKHDFGNLILQEENLMLENVVVKAPKIDIEQTMEGTTLNVQNSMMSKGSTALQLLERAPGVVLDQRNNSLTLNGKNGTLIMINGRPVRLGPAEIISLLEGMSADNLKKIELLTNPSSKYDADGGAGIINIITSKKVNEGTNGSASVSAGYGWGAKQAISLNLNNKKGSTNTFGSYSFNYDDNFSDFHGIGSQNMPSLGGDVVFDFKNNSGRKRASHNATFGIEKEVGKQIILGGNLMYTNTILKTNIYNDAGYLFQDNSFLHADINVFGRGLQNNFNTSLFAEKRFTNGSKINADVDFIYYENKSPTTAKSTFKDINGNATDPENELYANGNRGASNTNLNIGVMKLDYETKVNSKLKLDAGIKGSYSNTTNNAIIESLINGAWTADDRNRSRFEVKEKIAASYLSFDYSLDSLTSITTGLRYEFWDRDFSESGLDKRFGKFFSSAFISRTLNSSSSLQLAYNRRITRPDYNDLTNFLRYNDPTSVFTGTPSLQPAISDNIKLGYQFKNKSLAFTYSYESNPIARFQIVENERSDLVIIAPKNIDFISAFGMQANIPLSITDWWNLTSGGNVSIRTFELSYTRAPAKKEYVAYNLYANQNFSLPKNYSIELSGLYNSGQYNGSVQVEGYGMLNCGLKKELKNNNGSIQFTVTDLLESMIIRSKYGTLTQEAFNAQSAVKFQPESANARIFRISYSRNFGSTASKAQKQRQAGSLEEKSRIGQ